MSDVEYNAEKFCLFEAEYQVPKDTCCLVVFHATFS